MPNVCKREYNGFLNLGDPSLSGSTVRGTGIGREQCSVFQSVETGEQYHSLDQGHGKSLFFMNQTRSARFSFSAFGLDVIDCCWSLFLL